MKKKIFEDAKTGDYVTIRGFRFRKVSSTRSKLNAVNMANEQLTTIDKKSVIDTE